MNKYIQSAVMICLLPLAMLAQTAKPVQITTANGIVEGVTEKSGVRSFKGVPFAAPPVGMLRWQAPQPVQHWQGVRAAKQFAPKPMQTNVFGDMNSRADSAGEDCLYVNIWSPAPVGKILLPVLVYFYGGGFIAGDGSEPRYDGESMAQRGIVTVTVNYRLGVFGFMAHPELTAESPQHASGNYGLLDQAAALQWVHDNIAAFGGNPQHITIGGESAGSISVSALMASPLSRGLISGAIGESGSILGALPATPLSEGEQTGLAFAAATGSTSLAALRAIPADTLLKMAMKFGGFRFSRTVDGYFFPESPYEIYKKGAQAHVPLLVGWNNLEMNYGMLLGAATPTRDNYESAVKRLYGKDAATILQLYPATNDAEAVLAANDLSGDRFIAFSTWKWSNEQLNTGGAPVYRYLYERGRPEMTAAMGDARPGLAGGVQKGGGGKRQPPASGAVHSAEIEYALGNLVTNKVYDWKPEDYAVSRQMQTYFANFIKSYNPNGNGLREWPAAVKGKPVPVMHLNVISASSPAKNDDRYYFLDKLAAGNKE